MKLIKKILWWVGHLLSDSKFASTRRFINIQTFYNLIIFTILEFIYKQKLTNIKLIIQLTNYNFTIAMATIIGTSITDMAAIIKNSQLNNKKPINPFNYSKDEYPNR